MNEKLSELALSLLNYLTNHPVPGLYSHIKRGQGKCWIAIPRANFSGDPRISTPELVETKTGKPISEEIIEELRTAGLLGWAPHGVWSVTEKGFSKAAELRQAA